MADYTQSQYDRMIENPAAPTGLRQTASRWEQASERSVYGPQTIGEDAQSWYGGRNVAGIESGFDNDFMRRSFESYDAWQKKVAESRRSDDPNDWLNPYDWLDPEKNDGDVTGVALWDDKDGRFRRGDVIEDGEVRPNQNVYEVFGQQEADLLLGDFMFDRSTKARIFKRSDAQEAYAREVEKQSDRWTEEAAQSEEALRYKADVYTEQHEGWLADWRGTAATFGTGFTGGASLAGGGGFVASGGNPIVAGVSALVGGVVGGVGALLNQDQLENQIAHGNVQAERAKEKYGSDMFVASQLKHWSGVAMRGLSPVSNYVQGGADVWYGEVGDGEASFYEVDENGDRIVHGLWQAADVGAALADGVLQFWSPTGRAAYMATTGSLVAGQVGELGLTGARRGDSMAGFNERTGQWQEYEGAGQVAAALGVVAIDAIQMGVAGALGRASTQAHKVFDPARAGRVRSTEVLDGHKFKFDAEGNLIGRSVAVSTLIAPSEALRFVTVSWRARGLANKAHGALPAAAAGRSVDPSTAEKVRAAVAGGGAKAGMVTPDHYYEAAMELAHGSVLRSAIVNGWAEGAEEGVQAILEPLSFAEKIDGMEVGRSFMYGMAAGVGMGLGRVNQPVSDAQRQEYRAKSMWLLREGIPEPQTPELREELEAEWKQIWGAASAAEKKRMATLSRDEADRVNEIMGVYKELHTHGAMGSQIAYSSMNASRTEKYEELHRNRNRAVDGTRVLMGRGDSGPMVAAGGYVDPTSYIEDAAVQSLEQVRKDLTDIGNGLSEQIDALDRRYADVEDAWAEAADPDRKASLQAELEELSALREALPRARELNEEIVARFEAMRADYYRRDVAGKARLAQQINDMLLAAHDNAYTNAGGRAVPPEVAEAAKRAVEMRMVRYPGLDAGANTLLLPQVSVVLTELKQDATSYIHQSKLAAMNADHDGDQGVTNNAQVIPVSSLLQLRRGAQYLDSISREEWEKEYGEPPVGDARFQEFRRNMVKVRMDRPDGHKTLVEIARDALRDKSKENAVRRQIVIDAVAGFTGDFYRRYTREHKILRTSEDKALLGNLLKQLAVDLESGSKKGEQRFLDLVWNVFTEPMLELADETNQAEMLWQQGRLEKMWSEIQTNLAAQAAQDADRVSSGAPQTPPEESTFMRGKSRQDAATLGGTLQTLLDYQTEGLRQGQALHYSPWLRSAVETGRRRREGNQDPVRLQEFQQLYANLGSGAYQTALEDVTASNRIEARTLDMLHAMLREARKTHPELVALRDDTALAMIAMTETVDIEITGPNEYRVNEAKSTTLLQLLLQKSIEIEKRETASAREDSDIAKKIKRLEQLTRSKEEEGGHSVAGKRALFEVFADIPMWRIAGRDALGIGAHLTPRQLAMSVAQLDQYERAGQADKWRHLPSYLRPHEKKHDPPYSLEEFQAGETNSFTLMVDAIVAEANSAPKDMRKRDDRASERFLQFHTDLRVMREKHEQRHRKRLLDAGLGNKDGTIDKEVVFRDMLETKPELAQLIAEIIPGDARLAIFSKRNGEVWTANWLERMLLHDSSKKAELMLFIHSKLAELNAHGGRLEYTDELKEEHRKKLRIWQKGGRKQRRPRLPDPVRDIKDPSKIKSRFLQAVYRLVMEDPTGYELERLLDMADKAESREDFMEMFNSEPNWTGGQAEFFMYFDSMEAWQEDLSKLWTAGGGSAQLQREALDKAAMRVSMLSQGLMEADLARQEDAIMLDDMETFLTSPGDQAATAERWVRQLRKARELAKQYPDIIGYAARDQYLEMVQVGVPVAHEKGKPEEAVEPIGASLMTSNSLDGWSSGFSQEMAALTSHNWERVMANLTGLARGPVRVMFADGRYREIDFSDDLAVVRMLKDPVTREFAKAVLFPTTRDVDANNVMQHFRTSSTSRTDTMDAPLSQLLTDASLGHLFSAEKMGLMNARQATQFLGMVEANMRQAAVEGTKEDRKKADNPLTKLLGDILIAYTHAPQGSKMHGQAERDYVLQRSMTAMSLIAQLSPERARQVKKKLQEMLLEDLHRQKRDWGFVNLDKDTANALEARITAAVNQKYLAIVEDLQQQEADNNRVIDQLVASNAPQADIDQYLKIGRDLADRLAEARAEKQKYEATPPLWERVKQLHPSVQSAMNRWTQHINDRSDLDLLAMNRQSLINYLNTGTRINALVEKDLYRLHDKVMAAVDADPDELVDDQKISPEEWGQLGAAAAYWTVQESAAHISSAKGMMTAIKESEADQQVARYYDPTWSYLLDGFFDEATLLAARNLVVDQAQHKQLDVTYVEIADYLYNNLLNEQRLGKWTPLVVAQSITARKVLDGGSTLGAVQSEGMQPTENQAAVAASMVSFTEPDPVEHVSTSAATVRSQPDQFGLWQHAVDPLEFMKLDRHFVNRVQVTLPNGQVVQSADMLGAVTDGYPREPKVDASGWRILRSDLLEEYLSDLQQVHGSGDYVVEIDYVDVDKKPHEPDYVNSIYFDGVGREGVYSTGPSVVAEMIFGTGALNKMGQQLPLDFASKAGAAFWQQQITDYDKVRQTERSHTLAEMIAMKARHAFAREYANGPLLLGDQNAIYKLMKMRHIVKGVDPATGETRFMWSEEVISREANNETVLGGMRTDQNPNGYEVIPISDTVLTTLLGRPGTTGSERALTMPAMNLLDVDPFPKLDMARMRELGLERLGERAEINDTVFARVNPLAIATQQTDGRGAERVSPWELNIEFWYQHQMKVDGNRTGHEKRLRINGKKGSRNINRKLLVELIRSEQVANALGRLRIPFVDMRDFQAITLADSLTKRIDQILGPSSKRMIWYHDHSSGYDAASAKLGKAATDNDFRDVQINGQSIAPTYRDVVVIDLDTIWKDPKLDTLDKQIDEAMQAFRAYAKYGTTVVLGAKAAQQLRSEVALRIRDDGGTTYRAMQGSSHFFQPSKIDPFSSDNVDALESMSTEVRYVRADEAQYRFVSDYFGQFGSENSTMLDYEHAATFKFKRVVNVIIPSALGTYEDGRFMWNLPIRGDGPNNQAAVVGSRLLPKLDKDEVIAELKAMSEGDDKEKATRDGNPKDVPLLELDADGKVATEGVLSFDDAMDRFKGRLRSGEDPFSPTTVLLPGDFYMVLRSDQTPMLLRYGFKIPTEKRLKKQLRRTIGPGKAEAPLGIGIAAAQLQEEQTVPPPIRVRKVKPDGKGMKIEGDFDISVMTKGMVQGTGFKAGYRPMPEKAQAPTQPMSARNNTWINSYIAEQPIDSKQARRGIINNLQEAFVLSGIDFREDMVKFFFGENAFADEAEMLELWEDVQVLLQMWSDRYTNLSVEEAAMLLDTRGTVHLAQELYNDLSSAVMPTLRRPLQLDQQLNKDATDRTNRIGMIIMTTLMLPDIQLAHVIGTPGMLTVQDKTSDVRVVEMPRFLTDALADPNYPDVRNEMFRRINANAQWPMTDVGGKQKYEYYLNPDFTFDVMMRNENGEPILVKGKLQRITEFPYEKEAASIRASQLKQVQDASEHTVNVAAETISAWSVIGGQNEYEVNQLEELLEGKNEILYFDGDDQGFHQIFARVRGRLDYQPWDRKLPMQMMYRREAMQKMSQYRDPIDKKGWGTEHTAAAQKVLRKLGLDDSQMYEIDQMVRQWLGAPGARGEQTEYEIKEKDYVQAVNMMLGNLQIGMQPLMGAMVPMPSESFWAKVFQAQKERKDSEKWRPEMRPSWRAKRTKKAKSWDEWNVSLMGQVRSSTVEFNHMFRMDTDGFMHTFQNSSSTFADLPISLDTKRDMELMDPDVNRYLLSVDPGTDAFFASPIVLESMDFTLETMTGHQTDIITQRDARATPSSTIAQRLRQQEKWLKDKKVSTQQKQSYRDYYREGAVFLETTSRTHNFFLNLNHLQIMNRLANPALYVSAIPETYIKTKIEQLGDLAAGRGVTRVQGGLSRMIGVKPKYTTEELMKLEKLAAHLGSQTEWRAMLYGEMLYEGLISRSAPNRTSQFLEKGAATMARITSDPRLGMSGKPAAKRYIATALEWLDTTDSNITVDQFVRALQQDPLWLQKQFSQDRSNPHSAAINAVGQTRGTRNTWMAKVGMGFGDRWEHSDNWGLQLMGFMVNVPFRFKRFNVGTFLSMTGMGGFDTMFAMMRDGKPKTTLIGRMQAAMRGEAYQPEGTVDHSDILMGVDLTREMSKGAMTQTMLLAAGMFAGNLGLDGEDEESKRRRKLAEYLQGPYLYDPRKIENDFLYADALFVDNLGPLSTMFMDESTGRAAIQPHWIVRQFTSPVVGIQRFLNTGNVNEIWYGFQDAVSAIPTSALNIWRDASHAAEMLIQEADKQAGEGDYEAVQDGVTQRIINIAAVYEKALLENSFINAIRVGKDRFDRDPYAIAATDESGNIQRTDGLPDRSKDLEQYGKRDEEGELTGEAGQAYVSRPMSGLEGARSTAYAENNATWALIASLFSGQLFTGSSQFFRRNMPVKERKVEVPEVGKEDAEQMVLAALAQVGTEPVITLNEMTFIIKAEYEAADIRWEQAEVEAEAQARIDAMAMDGRPGGLFELGADNNVAIQHEGARGIYKALWANQLDWTDDVMLSSLPPIPLDIRREIADEWVDELIQFGVDNGMSQQGATYYARRVYYGDPLDQTSVALADILFDDRIPTDGTLKYNQLNMMYTIGPDGRPWATPFTKTSITQAFGIPVPHEPPELGTGMGRDARGKSVDEVMGINTGLHGLVRKVTPGGEDYDPFEKAEGKTYVPGADKKAAKYGGYYRRGGGGGYSGGGGGYYDTPDMRPLPRGTSPRADNVPAINTTNPYVRRARVNRQRITSERGRLKQWQ